MTWITARAGKAPLGGPGRGGGLRGGRAPLTRGAGCGAGSAALRAGRAGSPISWATDPSRSLTDLSLSPPDPR